MKINAISTIEDIENRIQRDRRAGVITFVYHHVDPTHKLLSNKFLYINSVDELKEKIALLEKDMTIRDTLHL